MIKCVNGYVEVEGRAGKVLGEFCCLTKALYEDFCELYGEEKARDLLDRSYNDGFAKEEEIVSDLSETVKGILEELFNIKEKKDGE